MLVEVIDIAIVVALEKEDIHYLEFLHHLPTQQLPQFLFAISASITLL